MELNRRTDQVARGPSVPLFSSRSLSHWKTAFAVLATATALSCGALAGQVPGQQPPSPNPDRPYLSPEANRLPNVNDQMRMREKKLKQQNFEAANTERKKQIAGDSEKLITLAMALKAEMDNTANGALTPDLLHKVEEIEKLAHEVQEKMKLTVGIN